MENREHPSKTPSGSTPDRQQSLENRIIKLQTELYELMGQLSKDQLASQMVRVLLNAGRDNYVRAFHLTAIIDGPDENGCIVNELRERNYGDQFSQMALSTITMERREAERMARIDNMVLRAAADEFEDEDDDD